MLHPRLRLPLAILFLLALLVASPLSAAEKRTKFAGDLAKGIRSQKDWIKRFKKTFEPRIFYLLACRAGREISLKAATQICTALKEEPDKLDAVLTKWGIVLDPKAYNKERAKEWQEQYGDRTLMERTPHYVILATKDDEILTNFLTYYMEKIFRYYQRQFPVKEQMSGRFLLYIYPDRQAYLNTGAPGFSGAYFSARERKLVGYVPPEHRNHRKWIADTRITTFFHEGMHQYLHYYIPRPPVWLDEGLAMMCESIMVRGKKLEEAGYMDGPRCQAIKAYVEAGKHIPIEKFVYLTHRQFYSAPDLCYPQGWAFLNFLKRGPREYRDIPDKTIEALNNGAEQREALDLVFEDVDFKELESDFVEYVRKLRPEKRNNTFWYPR